MSNVNNGGPAFPYHDSYRAGMNLRDYFAAKAMQGIISLGSNYAYTEEDMDSGTLADAIARYSYQVADTMLKEREK